MTTEEKFLAAVNVIRNLPKNGTFQPSYDIMGKFYGYYKQATEGPCKHPKPPFWEVTKRIKWEAWSSLGNMSRQEAMHKYVEELKKIVETMSYTDNVATFVGDLDSFYETVPMEDLELLVGPVLERMRSQPGSPLSGSPLESRETSPHRCSTSRHIGNNLENSSVGSQSSPLLPLDTDGEEEEFIDTIESASERTQKDIGKAPPVNQHQLIPNHAESVTDIEPERKTVKDKNDEEIDIDLYVKVAATLENLTREVQKITAKVHRLNVKEQPDVRSYPKWWPLPECSPRLFTIMIVWPFIAQVLVSFTQRYRQQRRL